MSERADLLARMAEAAGLSGARQELLAQLLAREGVELAGGGIPRRPPTGREAGDVVSFAQQRLWFLDRLHPGSSAYHMPAAVDLEGDLEVPALASALREIARRHEVLRATFAVVDGEPVQRLGEPAFELPVVDLEKLAADDRAAEAELRTRRFARRPFDLAQGPPARALLLRSEPRRHRALFVLHHIVADGWSIGVLLGELETLYRAAVDGTPSVLPALPIQYADFAHWQRQRLSEGGELDELLAWWRERLADAPQPLELPADREPPAAGHRRAATARLRLAPELVDEIDRHCRRRNATRFMTLLAAFQALLHRYSAQTDLVVGSPVANRERPEVQRLIGFFVNTLALRADLSGRPTFDELLAQVRESVVGAFAHQELPFEKLVEELAPERERSHTPFFRILFTVQEAPFRSLELPGLTLCPRALTNGHAKLDLILTFESDASPAGGGGLDGVLEYDRELFDATTVRRLLESFRTLLSGVLAEPGRALAELPLLSQAATHALVYERNDTATAFPRDHDLIDLFRERVERGPDAIAVVAGDGAVSYRELDRRSRWLAARLRALGVGPDSAVALALERSPALVEAILATLTAGGVYVPLDPAHPAERLSGMLEAAGARVVVGRHGPLEPWLRTVATTREVLWLDGDAPAGDPPPAIAGRRPRPEARAYVLFTSGSTGRPKGIAVPQRSVVRLVLATDYVDLGPEDRVAHASNTAFDAATFEIWGALLHGGTLVVVPPGHQLTPPELAAELARRRVSALFLTTALFNEVSRQAPRAFAHLRYLLFGGEAVDPDRVRAVLEAAPPKHLLHVYGPTECTTFATWQEVSEVPAGAATVAIGRPIANTLAHVVGRDLETLPAGAPGELVLGGDGLAWGYHGLPGRTAESFVPDPFGGGRLYRTGDRVRRRADGALVFLGRYDGQVKLRGFRVEPGEIEVTLRRHPQVLDAVVLVLRTAAGDRQLVGFVVPRTDAGTPAGDALQDELRAFLAARLPEFMVPPKLAILDALPLNANGKLDRRALAALAPGPAGTGADYVAPRDPTETRIAEIFADVLGLERVGVHDNFFAAGGHSLLATRATSRLREAFGIELPLRCLFEAPTVAGLARALREEAGDGGAAIAAEPGLPPAGSAIPRLADRRRLPLSFSQERLWFLDQFEPGTSTLNMPAALRLRGALDVRALAGSFDQVVRRHETLRTTFGKEGGEPYQEIAGRFDVPLPVVDLSSLPDGERRREAARQQRRDAEASFDLARGPLLRTRLLRLADGDHLLLLNVHHIVSDGWSMGLLIREVTAFYGELAAGRTALRGVLPAPPIQYADFATWQRGWLSGGVLQEQLAYWRQKLSKPLPALELPTDRPRPAVQSYRGMSLPRRLDGRLADALRELGRRCDATLFMTLLAAFKVLLGRWAGQRDVLVGSPIAGRNRREVEGLIGFFLNTLVLRTDLSGDAGSGTAPTFLEVLERVRQGALEAFSHQDLPFEKLLGELQPERDLSRTPLFQVFFNMLNFPWRDLALPGVGIEIESLPELPSKFDLTLYVSEEDSPADGGDGRGIAFNLAYNADLFTAERMAELMDQYELLLARIAERPGERIDRYPLVSARGRRLLPDPSAALDATFHGAVHEIFRAWARRAGERTAIVDRDGTLTYAEVDALSDRLAGELRAAGVGRGDRVVIQGHRSAGLVWALVGVLKAGGAFVVLDPAYPAGRQLEVIRQADPRAVVTLAAAGPLPDGAAAGRAVLELPARASWPELAAQRVAPPAVAIGPDDLAYVAFTSGSTGGPKGIRGRHGSLTHFIPWQRRAFELGPDDRFSLLSGLSHDPLHRDVFTPFQLGAAVIVPDPEQMFHPGWLAGWLARAEVTVAHLTPAMGQLLVEAPAGATLAEVPSLRWAFFVGDVLTRRDLARLRRLAPAVRSVNYFGSTETQRAVGYHLAAGDEETTAGAEILPLGRGMPDVQLLLLGSSGELAGIGEVGEICVRSPHVALGYQGDARLTAERFAPVAGPTPGERLYRTGDLGRYLPDGEAVFVGRADQQVKVRGFRVELGEIEGILGRHPAVREAVVSAIRQPSGDAQLAAWVVAAGGRGGEDGELAGELRDFLWRRLPPYMVPATFVELERLPVTPNGKVDRAALARRPLPAAVGSRDCAPPANELEEKLVRLWQEVLGVEKVGVEDNFFELGGHSLLLVRLHSRLQEELGRELRLVDLFTYPNVRTLAEHLGSGPDDGSEALDQARDRARRQVEAARRQRARARRR